MAGVGEQRIDKWLFFARLVKSRSLAQKLVQGGGARINREKTVQVAHAVRPGDVLTLSIAGGVKVLKVLDPGHRRGPAPEAAGHYEDVTPSAEPSLTADKVAPTPTAPGYVPSERPPSKRERRAMERFRWDATE